jgi:hypothetical protein
VDIFGRSPTASSQRVVSGGVTSTQATNAFSRRDGGNTATSDIKLNSHEIINVLNPTSDKDAATKGYVGNKISLPSKMLSAPYTTYLNTFMWKDYQSISPGLTEIDFDDLPAGLYACYTGYVAECNLDWVVFQQP